MRLQLPKIRDPENPHKYWVFEVCRSYAIAAEQKARKTYDNILRLADDPDVRDVIRFLREREIVHYQRFGEGMRLLQDKLAKHSPYPHNPYAFNPSFDTECMRQQPRQK